MTSRKTNFCKLEKADDAVVTRALAGNLVMMVDHGGIKFCSREAAMKRTASVPLLQSWAFNTLEEWEVLGHHKHLLRISVAEPRKFNAVFRCERHAQSVEDDIEDIVAEVVAARQAEAAAESKAPPAPPPPAHRGHHGAQLTWYPATPKRNPAKLPGNVALAVDADGLHIQGMPRSKGPHLKLKVTDLEKWGHKGVRFEVVVNQGTNQFDFMFQLNEEFQAAELDRSLLEVATRLAAIRAGHAGAGKSLLRGALGADEPGADKVVL